MKTLILTTLVAALTVPLLAGIPAGRGEISASVTGTATYDSNVFGTPDALADWSGLLIPRLTYVRKAGLIEAEADAGISFIRYLDQTQLDADNLDASVTLKVSEEDRRNYSGLLSAQYRESSELNPDLIARLDTQTAIYTARAALITGPRTNMTVSGAYTDTSLSGGNDQQVLNTEAYFDYNDFLYGNSLRLTASYDELQSSGLLGTAVDQNSYVVSAGLGRGFYHDTFRGRVSYGYRVLNRSAEEVRVTGESRRRAGYVIGLNLEGPFLPEQYFPKVTSQFNLSYQDAATPGIYDTGSKALTGRLSLTWQAREHTSVTLSASRIQRLAIDDQSVMTTNVRLSVEQTLRLHLIGTLSAGHDWSSYRGVGRDDRIVTLSAGLRYSFARFWNAHLFSTFTANTSTIPVGTYNRAVSSLSLSRDF